MSLKASTLLESPDIYPLRFDGPNLVFVRMSRETYQQSIFTLPNRIVRVGDDAWSIPFTEVMSMIEQSGKKLTSPNVIFQIAHCGSTLLARALDKPESSLVIREPFVLRQFSATPLATNESEMQARSRALSAIWYLLSRRYSEQESVIIKANVPVNYSLNEIIEVAPEVKGVLLYSDFKDYLVSVLKSDDRCMWAKHVVNELATHIKATRGFEKLDINSLNSAQATAVLWLTQIRRYESISDNSDDMKGLKSDALFKQPKDALKFSSKHLMLDMNDHQLDSVLTSELFTHHAKTPEQQFSEAERQSELSSLHLKFENEINDTLTWCEKHNYETNARL